MKATIDGLKVEIDQAKASDWHTFSLLRKAKGEDQLGQLDVLLELVEYVSDQTEESIVAHLGGDSAQAAEVIEFITEVIKAATPKN